MKFIDVHCHLDGGYFGDIRGVIEKSYAAGVERLIVCGVDLPTSIFCSDLSEKYDCVYFTAGFHPTELKEYGLENLKRIEELALHEKCVAIGEIGLDYHYFDKASQTEEEILRIKEEQKKAFIEQIEVANRLNLPVEIHSRDCAEDTFEIIKENLPLLKNGYLLHCYSYSLELAKEFEKMGGYFSFGGTSTYSGSKRVKRVICGLDESRILTETDSPYLPPLSKRGTFPNTPESIVEIAENAAYMRGNSLEDTAKAIWNNAFRLFKKLK